MYDKIFILVCQWLVDKTKLLSPLRTQYIGYYSKNMKFFSFLGINRYHLE